MMESKTPPLEESPISEPKPNRWLIFVPSAIAIISLVLSVFLIYQNLQLKERLSQPAPTAQPTTQPDPLAGWKTYTNTKYKYLLEYPQGWFLNFVSLTGQQFSDIESNSPYDTRVRVDVNSISAESFREKYDTAIGTRSEVALKVTEEKVANLTVDGRPAVKLTRTPSEGATSPSYTIRILVTSGNDVIEISSWGKSKEDQQKHNDTFNQILSTFKFLDQGQAEETAGWETYTNNTISFMYPPDFYLDTVVGNDSSPTLYSKDPRQNNDDIFYLSFWVAANETFEGYIEKRSEFNNISYKQKQIGAYSGYQVTGEPIPGNVSEERYYVEWDGTLVGITKGYTLSDKNSDSGFKLFSSKVDQILSTFKFTD